MSNNIPGPYSISATTPFSAIDWDNFQNRPPINSSMTFCDETNWNDDVKCCMDGYSLEHVLEVSYKYGLENTPEVRFLDQYPCLNGPEIDHFADEIESMPSNIEPEEPPSTFPSFECLSESVFEGLKKMLPKPLLDSLKPYLCRE